VTNRFRTFYRLTKPLLMSILLILNFFHCSKEKIPQPKFCGDPDRWTPTGLAPGAVHVGGLCVCVCVWSSVAAVAREPRNLEHTFIIISNNITARLSWHEPDSPDVMLSGYRVVWGQLVQSDPIQMDSAALTKVLPKVRIRCQLLDHRHKDRLIYTAAPKPTSLVLTLCDSILTFVLWEQDI